MKYLGDLEQSVRRFGENVWRNMLVIWRRRVRRFGENLFGNFWRKCVDDLEKSFGDIGENRSAITLEIWRNVVGAVMAISYWSSLWSSIELGDRKWGLNHNGEKVETSYGDQNFIQHKSGEYISRAFQG